MKADDKFQPDEIMYNSILDGCAKQHRVEDALRILEEMQAAGVGPSNYTLSILVKLLGHARRLGQAFKLVDDLSSQNRFRPSVLPSVTGVVPPSPYSEGFEAGCKPSISTTNVHHQLFFNEGSVLARP